MHQSLYEHNFNSNWRNSCCFFLMNFYFYFFFLMKKNKSTPPPIPFQNMFMHDYKCIRVYLYDIKCTKNDNPTHITITGILKRVILYVSKFYASILWQWLNTFFSAVLCKVYFECKNSYLEKEILSDWNNSLFYLH